MVVAIVDSHKIQIFISFDLIVVPLGTVSLNQPRKFFLKRVIVELLRYQGKLLEDTIIIVWEFADGDITNERCKEEAYDRSYDLADICARLPLLNL